MSHRAVRVCVHLGLLVLLAAWAPSCTRVPTLRQDQRDMRSALLCLYEDQMMDNLIRAKNLLPMIQVDYGKMTGTVDTTLNVQASATGENTGTDYGLRPEGLAGPTTASNVVVNVLRGTGNLAGSNSKKSSLTVTGEPVVGNAELYAAYTAFVSDPTRFVVSKHPPADPKRVHVGRWWRGDYYYVPLDHAQDFMRLYFTTTVGRGGGVLKTYYEVTVTQARLLTDAGDGKGAIYNVSFTPEVPNDSGKMIVGVEGPLRSLPLQEILGVGAGQDTSTLAASVGEGDLPAGDEDRAKRLKLFGDLLKGQKAKVYLHEHAPRVISNDEVLADIAHQLELLRLGGSTVR